MLHSTISRLSIRISYGAPTEQSHTWCARCRATSFGRRRCDAQPGQRHLQARPTFGVGRTNPSEPQNGPGQWFPPVSRPLKRRRGQCTNKLADEKRSWPAELDDEDDHQSGHVIQTIHPRPLTRVPPPEQPEQGLAMLARLNLGRPGLCSEARLHARAPGPPAGLDVTTSRWGAVSTGRLGPLVRRPGGSCCFRNSSASDSQEARAGSCACAGCSAVVLRDGAPCERGVIGN